MSTPILNMKKKESFCNVYGLELKELGENLEVRGFIATTHLDDGWFDDTTDMNVKDRISKETLDAWVEILNDGNPRANKASLYHDRNDKIVIGAGKPGTAKVMELPDGEFGLYIDTIIDSTHPDFDMVKNRIDIGTLDSFSIEFLPGPSSMIKDSGEDYMVRELHADSELYGYSLVPRPMNEHAVMLKEIMQTLNNDFKKQTEVNKMTEDIVNKEGDSEVKEPVSEPVTEPVVEPTPEPEQEEKEVKVKTMETKDAPQFSEDDMKILQEAKESMIKLAHEKDRKEMIESIREDLKESLKSVTVENKVMFADKEIESKEAIEYKEMLTSPEKVSLDRQWNIAGKMADKMGLTVGGLTMDSQQAESRVVKSFACNGRKMEMKLGITSNQNTDTDYLLSAAELHDVFDPIIYNALNEATVTWNLLTKEDYSMKGNNQVQFVLKTGANSTAAAYLGNAVSTDNTDRLKVMTKFKKYQVGVEVDGDMIAAAKGGPFGDVFALEVRDSTESLLSVINAALFAENGTEASAGIIGFEYLSDSAGNTTLYNLTRTSYLDVLSCTTVADQYINGSSADLSLANLRALKRNALKRGITRLQDLVFIGDHIQGDKLRGIYDAAQRMVPTVSRWGFEGMMSFDGIPFFEDKDCDDSDVWIVDLSKHKVAMWVPPTLEMLGKDSDSVKGFVKTYFATYNTLPTTLGQIYDNATT